MFSLNEIIEEISKVSGTSEDAVKKKIEEKQLELSGLVSPEGAAYIVGKELGVNLLKETVMKSLEIKNIVSGMRSVEIEAKITNISEKRDFDKNGRSGSVVNVYLADETGSTRLSLWNDEIANFETLGVKVGDVVKISSAYVKENAMGNSEMRIGRMGKIVKTDKQLNEISDVNNSFESVKLKNISDLNVGDFCELRASLVQVYKKSPFFEVCPTCGSRIENKDGSWNCKEHGIVEPKYNMVISGVLDDGTGNIRGVFFREMAEKIFGKSTDELRGMITDDPLVIFDTLILGNEFTVKGKVKRNDFTESNEIIINDVNEINSVQEAKNIIKELEN
ncbi:MAG: hypothetical protein KAS04_03330 [Candidatus Aenigmarchaeota archaeon]|nr:hypothetical protein [Candidatus Aenigmarchaeota archaeon]